MKAVQGEDLDGLAQLLIKAGHLLNFLWIGHKAGVQLLIVSVNIGNHQHHELHGFSPWFLFGSCTLVVWRPPDSTHKPAFFDLLELPFLFSKLSRRFYAKPDSGLRAYILRRKS